MRLKYGIAIASAFLFLVSASPARADVVLTPYVGSLFGGDLQDGRTAYGATAAFMGGGIMGAEIGFNYTPTFSRATVATQEVSQASLMANLILGIPMGGESGPSVRPYVTGGAGLFRARGRGSEFFDPITSNDFAVNAGGGVMAFFTDHVGVRGDVRYFRTLRDDRAGRGIAFDLGDLNFWKWDVGAAFRF